ncbi:hypothetical protein ASPACDRAFT_60059 [Aspergillus aculeatus ATCC 16872]|uniref:Thioester reductase (TE) domain-containing protein n=1 Tax=Aspergillus aculeatus (strain ATCC 16872 / CBS 172.66 / WB 5094) TaxID=690307 RepID=A0A1L9WVD4_ASPA1|nr:uncharacterized protein ASPACDRAFT_60059 [Aspergillus aculeatus ATCC 16872]OJK00211.1 hypothetical protein ASPACDRAFT_60059 [Aspergillus aculeatus ATCC 16872]
MEIILAGTTGLIGQEVLTQCLAHPSITSILVLSRRELPSNITYPKLQVRRMQDQDFLSYSDPHLAASLLAAAACIWTLGVPPSRASADEEASRRVTLEYTSQAAVAFNEAFTASLAGTEREEAPSAAAEHPATFESYIMRPGMVLSRQGTLVDRVQSLAPSVWVDVLARAAVDLAVQGHSEKIWENSRITDGEGVGGQQG